MTETQQLVQFDLVIGGESAAAASGATYDSVDPYTGQAWARVPDGDGADIDRAVAAARAALNGPWGALTATARGKLLCASASSLHATPSSWPNWKYATAAS